MEKRCECPSTNSRYVETQIATQNFLWLKSKAIAPSLELKRLIHKSILIKSAPNWWLCWYYSNFSMTSSPFSMAAALSDGASSRASEQNQCRKFPCFKSLFSICPCHSEALPRTLVRISKIRTHHSPRIYNRVKGATERANFNPPSLCTGYWIEGLTWTFPLKWILYPIEHISLFYVEKHI